MDITKTLADLREYKSQLGDAIAALEALAHLQGRGGAPRRESTGHVRSDETRKRMAESQRKRWAAYRKAKQAVSGGNASSRKPVKSK